MKPKSTLSSDRVCECKFFRVSIERKNFPGAGRTVARKVRLREWFPTLRGKERRVEWGTRS